MKIKKSELLEMIDRAVVKVVTEKYGVGETVFEGIQKLTEALAAKGAKNPKGLAEWIINHKLAEAKSMAPGGGGRFAKLKTSLAHRKDEAGVRDPAALAAWIGRKKYGKEKMAQMSAAGRKRAEKK